LDVPVSGTIYGEKTAQKDATPGNLHKPLAVPAVQDLLYGGPVTPPTLRPAVWYTAPWYAVRRACPNRLALRRADTLRRRGRGRAPPLAAGGGRRLFAEPRGGS